MTFIQEPPAFDNQYLVDPILREYIARNIPEDYITEIDTDLQQLGIKTIESILEAGEHAQEYEPELIQFDAWGKRVDEVKVAEGWERLHDIAAEEGLVAIGYTRKYQQYSRIYQMAKLLLFTPSSAIYTCPLAMTDGAARVIELLAPEELEDTFHHLTSEISEEFWTAGQWMTEREGGSDVSQSSTIARTEDGEYRLYGDKWFTSAIDGNIAMCLARVEEEDGTIPEGSRGLSLFYLKIRDEHGELNGIEINKLKDKLGTRAMPTAELKLKGTKARLLGEKGRGVKLISTILNITRIYNAVSSISYMHRGLLLAKDYATKREAFGQKLIDLPLHQQTLADLETEYVTSFLLTFYAVELMGKVETGMALDEQKAILRLITPLVKLYTGKKVVAFISEIIECFGGQGYIEDTGIPALFRDAQVFPIWEGTTNVLSLDVIRAMSKEHAMQPLLHKIRVFIDEYDGELETEPIENALEDISSYVNKLEEMDIETAQLGARAFAMSLSRTIATFRLLEFHDRIDDTEIEKRFQAYYYKYTKANLVNLVEPGEMMVNQDILK